ncbi:class III lanthionine synthetase LanKC [Trueperella pyogenes]|uniref:class III lanthionine synthetase LanKC n=1 Tax=Trueperella pyogenes TaxID=1661 RepID=UPI0024C03706|nr:class III lanthionine synthetase LanKC [Trueperella pyogenes]WHU61823.1 class III lanthionine synthetase LanKC [Trueperella pyogenes]
MARPVEIAYVKHNGLFYSDGLKYDAENDENTYHINSLMEEKRRSPTQEWEINSEGPWVFVNHKVTIPDQGWKIHVSAIPDEAQKILHHVEQVALKLKFSFKFLRSSGELSKSLGKYADRVQSGKFIAIYPSSVEHFEEIVKQLVLRLEGFKGPDVLTDVRFGTSPVHARYGGFKRMTCMDQEGNLVPAIRNREGLLVPDIRTTDFIVPEGVTIPSVCAQAMEQKASKLIGNAFSPFRLYDALHFSNAGGVYLAKSQVDDRIVVVKEGRPWVGLDEAGRFACERIQHERTVIDELNSVSGVVNGLGSIEIFGHTFLLEEYVDGVPLTNWIAQNYPYSHSCKPDTYLSRAAELIRKIHKTVAECHNRGWAILDLQPMNILVNDDEICLIDFEAAVKINNPSTRALGTPGFVPNFDCSVFENDWFAFNVTLLNMLVPLVPLNAITEDLEKAQINRARSLFGQLAEPILSYLYNFSARPIPEIRCYANEIEYDLDDLKVKLENGISSCLSEDLVNSRIPGDILQFEPFGKLSINHGLSGVYQYMIPEAQEHFAERVLLGAKVSSASRGYLSGIDGALLLLEQSGLSCRKERELSLDRSGLNNLVDISLRTGLSGLVLIDIARALTSRDVNRSMAEERAQALAACINLGGPISSRQATSTTQAVGLLDGRLGAALALFAAAEIWRVENLYDSARTAIDTELKSLVRAPDGSVQLLDNNRLMPYMAEGSCGFLIAASMCPPIAQQIFQDYTPEEFCAATNVRTVANGGLHLGLTGLILARHLAYRNGWIASDFDRSDFLSQLALHTFILQDKQGITNAFLGGQGGLRLSADFSTGNAGVIRTIDVLTGRRNQWAIFPGLEPLKTLWK